jgi:hypothetical protein
MNNNEIEIQNYQNELKKKFSRTGSLGFRFTTNIYKNIGGIDKLSMFLNVRKIDGKYYLHNGKTLEKINKETILSYFPFTDQLATKNII